MCESREHGLKLIIGGFLLLMIRGFALWILVPLGFIWWVIAWLHWHRKHVGLGQLLGWMDLNLIALIQRSVLRPFWPRSQPWVRLARVPEVTHRVRRLDPA